MIGKIEKRSKDQKRSKGWKKIERSKDQIKIEGQKENGNKSPNRKGKSPNRIW